MSSEGSNSLETLQEDQTYILELELADQEDLFGSSISSQGNVSEDESFILEDVRLIDQPSIATNSTTTMSNPLELRGVQYSRCAAKKTVNESDDQVLHKKQNREKLTADERTKLFKEATQLQHKKYDYVPMALNDEDKLDDTYNLDVLINKTY
jgi:hypothetical protein